MEPSPIGLVADTIIQAAKPNWSFSDGVGLKPQRNKNLLFFESPLAPHIYRTFATHDKINKNNGKMSHLFSDNFPV